MEGQDDRDYNPGAEIIIIKMLFYIRSCFYNIIEDFIQVIW